VVTGVWPDVNALVMSVSLGLFAGAERVLWLDGVLSTMAVVIFAVGVVGGVVILRRRRDQDASNI
jgi:hypothetical protein